MTSEGQVKADSAGLHQMITALRQSTDGVDGVAKSAPPMPQVTISSEKVGYTISEIMKTIAGLTAHVQQTADQIHASDGSYAQTDNQQQLRFNQHESHLK